MIYRGLKQAILVGTDRPHQRIVISEVAKESGISEIPVREALRLLASEGLIQITPHVGAVVTNFNIEDLENIFQIRILLEATAIKMACRHMKEADFERLERIFKNMEMAIREKRYDSFTLLNRDLHEAIYAACGNEYLNKVIFELWDLSSRSRGVFRLIPPRALGSFGEHKKINQKGIFYIRYFAFLQNKDFLSRLSVSPQ